MKSMVSFVLTLIVIWCMILPVAHETEAVSAIKTESLEAPVKTEENSVSLVQFQKINADVQAIIRFDERIIEEAVVQAQDNSYYVYRDLHGNKTTAGAVFIDCTSSLTSENTVIYGHSSTKREILFTPLMNYKNKDYWINHPFFILETEKSMETYLIFSVFLFDTKNEAQAPDFVVSNWQDKEEKADYLTSLHARSLYQTDISVEISDKLVTLVTCDTRNNDYRLVLVAKKVIDET